MYGEGGSFQEPGSAEIGQNPDALITLDFPCYSVLSHVIPLLWVSDGSGFALLLSSSLGPRRPGVHWLLLISAFF
jgi:hypothetical protein